MDHDERQTLAKDRAETYAPAPTGGLLMAGLCAAAVALGGDFVVSGFYGWAVRDHPIVAVGVTVVGFLTGWSRTAFARRWGYRHRSNRICGLRR